MSDNLIGATTAIFYVRLSNAAADPVDVQWATRDGSAIGGTDYKPAKGVVTFLPGETEKQIEVLVYGQHVIPSDDKVFFINLNPPNNAVLVDALLTCRIVVDDSGEVPVTSIVVAEGRRGPKGAPGLSSYELAVYMGEFTGTIDEWMEKEANAARAAERAEAAAVAANIAGKVYSTPEAGVNPNTGVPVGDYFNVRSPLSTHYVDEYQNVGGAAVPTGKSYPTAKGVMDAQAIAEQSAAIAEAAATAATIGAGVFDAPEDGVDPVTGVADGAYFNVRSSSDESYVDEYQNVGGSAVATGKRYLSSLGVQQQEKAASTIKDASGRWQQEINYLSQNVVETEYRLLDFIPRNLHSKIKDYTSLADVSTYVQAAIDEVGGLGGGTILIPNGMIWACVELKDSVQLVGSNSHARPAYSGNEGTVWRNADDAFASVVTPSTRINACGIAGIQFRGKSANSIGGVRYGVTFGASLKNCSFNTFKHEAFIAEGLVGTYEDLIAVNTLLQRERAERTGCFKFLGADHYISKIEGNTGISGIINPDLNLAGIYIGGANHYADKLMGELSEVGVFVTNSGAAHKITTSRADLNFGHGWLLGAGTSNLVNCHAHNNSNKSNGVYSGFKAIESSLSQNKLLGCFGTTSPGFAHKFDFDLVGSDIDTPALRGGLWNCKGTRNLPTQHGSLGSQQTGLIRTSSSTPSATLHVDSISTVWLYHNLEGFTGGTVGQRVSIVPAVAGLKLKRTANFQLAGGYITPSNERVLAANSVYTFEQTLPNVWREVPNATPLSGGEALRPHSTSVVGSTYYDTDLDRPIFRNAANNAFVNALGGQLSKPTITGKLSPTTISEQNAVLSSIVSALVAAGVVTDGRT